MPAVSYKGRTVEVQPGESVLDGLLRHDVAVPHACKAGSCGSCLLRGVEGAVPAQAQLGLKDSWKARGYFLACQCRPETDLVVEVAGSGTRVAAEIVSMQQLTHNVMRVRLACLAPFEFRPGQYVSLLREDGLARSYSIASLNTEAEIELHVRRVRDGLMSNWLFDAALPGDRVHLQGPFGECFYTPGREQQPLLLIGTGTGLAPLYGIVRDALQRGHSGPIHLIHGALRSADLYLRQELQELVAINYTASVLETSESGDYYTGPLDLLIAERFQKLAGWRGFVCGDPAIVQSLRRKLFLAGMAMNDILADAFVPAANMV